MTNNTIIPPSCVAAADEFDEFFSLTSYEHRNLMEIIARHTRVAELEAALVKIANLVNGTMRVATKLDKINTIARRALGEESNS